MRNLSPLQASPSGRFDAFRTQRNRRIIVSFYLSTLGALLLVTGLVDSYLPAIPLGAMYAVGMIMLLYSTRGITNSSSGELDEHQVEVRNAGYRNSYWVGTMIALAGGYAISEISNWDTAFELGLIIAVWGLLTAMPTMVVAWNLSNEVVDEEE